MNQLAPILASHPSVLVAATTQRNSRTQLDCFLSNKPYYSMKQPLLTLLALAMPATPLQGDISEKHCSHQ